MKAALLVVAWLLIGTAQAGNPEDPTDFYHAVIHIKAMVDAGIDPFAEYGTTERQKSDFLAVMDETELLQQERVSTAMHFLCGFKGSTEALAAWAESNEARRTADYVEVKRLLEARVDHTILLAIHKEATELPYTREGHRSRLPLRVRDGSWRIEDFQALRCKGE